MRYENAEMKVDEIASYFREGKISLIPPFQRARVWTLKLRQKLIANMVQGKADTFNIPLQRRRRHAVYV